MRLKRKYHYEGSPLLYAACRCGEYRGVALRKKLKGGWPQCMNCADTRHARGVCIPCQKDAVPIEQNHIAGRRYSPDVITVCLNCHALLTQAQRVWLGKALTPEAHWLCGALDLFELTILGDLYV